MKREEIVAAALEGFQARITRIESVMAGLRGETELPLNGNQAEHTKRRKMSAAGRKAIRDGIRRHWEAVRATKALESSSASYTTTKRPYKRRK